MGPALTDSVYVESASTVPPEVAAFARAHPSAQLYQAPEYWSFLEEVTGGEPVLLVARRGAAVRGVLVLLRREVRGHGTIVNSLPWYGSHGGALVAPGDHDARVALLEAYAAQIARSEVLCSTLILPLDEQAHVDSYRAVSTLR